MFPTAIIVKLHDGIQLAILGIVDCLKDSDCTVQCAAINGVSDMVLHGMCYLPSPMIYSTIILAELHGVIRIAVPSLVECLKDPEWSVRQTTINGLSRLATHRMPCPSAHLWCTQSL